MRMCSHKMHVIIMLMTNSGELHHKHDNHNQT